MKYFACVCVRYMLRFFCCCMCQNSFIWSLVKLIDADMECFFGGAYTKLMRAESFRLRYTGSRARNKHTPYVCKVWRKLLAYQYSQWEKITSRCVWLTANDWHFFLSRSLARLIVCRPSVLLCRWVLLNCQTFTAQMADFHVNLLVILEQFCSLTRATTQKELFSLLVFFSPKFLEKNSFKMSNDTNYPHNEFRQPTERDAFGESDVICSIKLNAFN